MNLLCAITLIYSQRSKRIAGPRHLAYVLVSTSAPGFDLSFLLSEAVH